VALQSTKTRLGRELRAARRQAGLTQAALASSADVGISAVLNLERGRGTLSSWRPVLDALGVELRGRSLAAGPVGASLAALRCRRGLSRRELARSLGASRNTLARLEAGGPGRLETLEAYGEVIGAGLHLAPARSPLGFYAGPGNSSAHHGWETPLELVASLETALGRFDLDPCAAAADLRSARVKARVRLTMADNGLAAAWRGRVFVNPPYGRQLGRWIEKCAAEAAAGALVVGLVPARTCTRWWHDHVAGAADVFMLRGRLRFGDGEQAAPFPSAVVVWGGEQETMRRLGAALPGAWHVPRQTLALADQTKPGAPRPSQAWPSSRAGPGGGGL
jgi:phage N-6-adenine-methyltransferase